MKLHYLGLASNQVKEEKSFRSAKEGEQGGWLLLKCFYDDKGRYGEFYFNYNVKTGEAEIAPKDVSYAPALLEGFRKMVYFSNQESKKEELIDWNKFTDILLKLAENKSETISRHAKGLIKELKL